MTSSLIEAEFSTAVLFLNKRDINPRVAAGALLDAFGAPGEDEIAKAKATTRPGDHGIPEIGRAEKAFRDSLNAGQREAYDNLKKLVYQLFRHGAKFENIDPWTVDEPINEWKRRVFRALLDEPMKAYMLGQLLAREFLKGAEKKRPLLPTDKEAIAYLRAYTLSEIDAKMDEVKGTMRNVLIRGVQEGWNPKKVAQHIAAELDDYSTDWDRIAITETSRAESQGRLNELREQGITHVQGSSAHDPRTCPDCLRLIDGQTYAIVDVIGKSNYGRKRKDYLPVIPLHPRCRCVWLPA